MISRSFLESGQKRELDHTPQLAQVQKASPVFWPALIDVHRGLSSHAWIGYLGYALRMFLSGLKCIFSSFQLFRSPTCCEVGRVDLEEGVPKCKGDPGCCQTENIVPKNCWLTWNLKIPLGEGETFPNHQFFVSMFFLSGVELVFVPTHFDVWDIFRNQKLFGWESPKNILRVAMIAWKKSSGWKKHTPRKASTTKKSNTSWNTLLRNFSFFWKQVSGLSSISKNL